MPLFIAPLGYTTKLLYEFKGVSAVYYAIFSTITMLEIKELFKNAEQTNLILILLVQSGFLFFFMIITTLDMFTGIQAAKRVNKRRQNPVKNVIKSHKLWVTGYKFSTVIIVTGILCFLTLIAEILDSWVFLIFLWSLIWFWAMVIGYEIKSLGENIKKINNDENSGFFDFFDRVIKALENAGIKRAENIISGQNSDLREYPEDYDEINRDEDK